MTFVVSTWVEGRSFRAMRLMVGRARIIADRTWSSEITRLLVSEVGGDKVSRFTLSPPTLSQKSLLQHCRRLFRKEKWRLVIR